MTCSSKSRFYFDPIKIKFVLLILFILVYIDQSTACDISCTCDQYKIEIKCTSRWPHKFPKSTTKLILANSDIDSFEGNAIKNLSNLKELSLEHSTISFIQNSAIANLPALETLSLKYNKIQDLDEGAIMDLPTLRKISLENNEIYNIHEGAIKNLPTLKNLSLKYNQIQDFAEGAIMDLPTLRKITLKYNNITYFNEATFKDLTELEHVYLYNNKIAVIETGNFRNLNNLKSLYLYGNTLPTIPSTMFQHLPSLEKLILRNNHIKHFEDGSFLFLPNIIEIDLRDKKDMSFGCHLPAVVDYINKTYNRHVRTHCNMELCKNQVNLMHPSRDPSCQNYSLFQQKLQCQTCSGIKCYNPKVTNCHDATSFCMSRISMIGDSIKFEKSCSTYKECLEAEKNNIFSCKALQNGTSCAVCCTGNLCNKNNPFGFTKSFNFQLRFPQNSTTYNWSRSTIDSKNTYGIRLSTEMQMELESRLPGLTKVEYCGLYQNQVIFHIYCTVSKRISDEELHSGIKTALNAIQIFAKTNRIQIIEKVSSDVCCESTTSINGKTLYWPVAESKSTVKIPCHGNVATRHCHSRRSGLSSPNHPIFNSFWGEPNISECHNTDWITRKLMDMKRIDIEKQNTEDLSKQLLNITQRSSHFNVKQISLVVDIYENIESQISNVTTNTITDYILLGINNIIDTPEEILVEAERSDKSAKRILDVVKAISENIQPKEQQLSHLYSNLGIGVSKVKNTNFNGSFYGILSNANGKEIRNMIYNSSDPDTQQDVTMMDFISLPKSLFNQQSKEDLSTISKVLFHSMHNDKLFRVIERSDNETNNKIRSRIIAANVPNIQITDLVDPVIISFNLLDKNATNLQCAFWDETPGQTPHWSTKGCDVSKYIPGVKVLCSCDHLTSFALVMNVYQNEKTVKSPKVLSAISNIGCGISFVFLILTVIIHVYFKNLWKLIASKILVNLCSSLAVTNLIFLVGMQPYALKVLAVCKTMAAFFHYFLLTTMMWMTVEAIHIYLSVIAISTTYQKSFMKRSSILAWGLPAIIVSITLAVNYTNNYVRIAEICWLSKIPFYTALLSPIVIILIINLAVFSCVIWRLISMQSRKKFEHKTRKVRVWGIVGLFFLLGLSWLLAFFTFGEAAEVFKYLFVIFSTLQGLSIFIFYCLYKKDTRDTMCTYVSRRKEKSLQKDTKNKPSSSSADETQGTTSEISLATKTDL